MKQGASFIAILLFLSVAFSYAQVPQGIKYQAVARGSDGNVYANQNINLRVLIIDSTAGGVTRFGENHKVATNKFGLFSITIGEGTNKSGTFETIPWGTGELWLEVRMDPTGGNDLQPVGVSKLVSVPYALYAKNAGGPGINDTSKTNELITNFSFDPNSNLLSITEAGTVHDVTINKEADDLSDNALNDLSDVNASPTADQILKWNGTEWVAATEQTLILDASNNYLIITGGDTIDLSSYLDNTDSQQVSFDTVTNILSLSNGGSVDLTDLSVDSYNDTMFYNSGTKILTIRDGGGTVQVNLANLINDADSVVGNEYNTAFAFNSFTKILSITDGGGTDTVNLSSLVNDADASPTNELLINAQLVGTDLILTDVGASWRVDLSSILNDADANPTNELQNLNWQKIGSNVTIGITNGNNITFSVNDADPDATNELLRDVRLNGTALELEDAGGITTVDLSSIVDDADADPGNEIQSLSYNPNNKLLGLSGSPVTVDLTGLVGTDNQDLIAVYNPADETVTMHITGGASTTFSIVDKDNDVYNELIKIFSFDSLSNRITIGDMGDTLTLNLQDLVNDAYNTGLTFNPVANTLTITDKGTSFVVPLQDLVNDAYNISVGFDSTTNLLSVTDGGGTKFINIGYLKNDADASPTNELQNLSQVKTGNNIAINITNGTGTNINIDDADANPTNEIQDLSLTGTTLNLSSDLTPVSLSAFLDNTDNQNLSSIKAIDSVTVNITGGTGTKFSVADKDNDPVNELQTLSLASDTLKISGVTSPINLLPYKDNTDNQNLSHVKTANNIAISITNGIGTTIDIDDADANPTNELQTISKTGNIITLSNGGLSVTVDDADASPTNEIQDLSLTGTTLSLSSDITPVDLSGFLDNTDSQNLSSVKTVDSVTVNISGGTGTKFSVADKDNDPLNELQTLSVASDTLKISGVSSPISLQPYKDNTDNQTLNFAAGTLSITGGNSVIIPDNVNDADSSPTNELNTSVIFSNDTLRITDAGGTIAVNLGSLNNTGTDDQILNFTGTILSIEDGNNVDLSSLINDADADATNELQTLSLTSDTLKISGVSSQINLLPYKDNTDNQNLSSVKATDTVTVSITGGIGTTFSVADKDNDPVNELQSLVLTNDTLKISGVSSPINLQPYKDNTDNQTLNFAAGNLSITGGNSVVIPDNVDDADANPANELIIGGTLNGTTLEINDAGGTTFIDLSSLANSPDADSDSTNELQTISKTGNTVTLSNGGGSFNDDVNDADANPTNELQTISFSNDTLSISQGNFVVLPGDADSDPANELITGGILNGTTLEINDAGGTTSIDLSSLANTPDADSDSTNELQTISKIGSTVTLSNGGGSFNDDVNDADANPTNELQTITLSNDTLSISQGNFVVLPGDADSDSTNEYNTSFQLFGNSLTITDGGGTLGVDLTPFKDNTDTQALSISSNVLSITGGNSVNLSPYLDNTDAQNISILGTTLSITGGNSINIGGVNTDAQTLSLVGNNLSISNGNNVSLAGYLDNTDSQNLSSVRAGDSVTVNISGGLSTKFSVADNDNNASNELQDISLNGNTLELTNSASTVDLSPYLDNTDQQNLSINSDTVFIANGNFVILPPNGFNPDDQFLTLTGNTLSIDNANSVDLSPFDQDLSLNGNTLEITNGTSVDLSSYLDNTDDQSLNLSGDTLYIEDGNFVDLSLYNNSGTDDQNLSLIGNTLGIEDGNTVDLAPYLDNTDNQLLSIVNDSITIANGNAVSLSPYLDNTDDQLLNLNGNSLEIEDGNAVDLSGYLDNTDDQSLNLSGDTLYIEDGNFVDLSLYNNSGTDDQNLSLIGNTLGIEDGNTVDLAPYLDNTDNQLLSIVNDTLSIANGNLVSLLPYLDNTDTQNLNLNGTTLEIDNGSSADLSGFLDNTDSQTLTVTNDSLSITGGNVIDLSSYLDNTDSQMLSITNDTLAISGGNFVDLSGYLDNTDTQGLSFVGTILSIDNANSVDLSSLITGGDSQTLTLDNDTLKIQNGNQVVLSEIGKQSLSLFSNMLTIENANTVNLAPYLDNTDNQTLTISGNTISISGGNSQVLSDNSAINELQTLSLSGASLSILNGNSVNLASFLDNTDNQLLAIVNDTLQIEDGNSVSLKPYLDNQTLSINGDTLFIQDGNHVLLSAGNDNQNLALVGNDLQIEDGNLVDLSGYLDNTDDQSLNLSGDTLYIENGNFVDLSAYNNSGTDDQNLNLIGNTLGIEDGNTVDLAPYLDNTDAQLLSIVNDTLSIDNGNAVNLLPYLDNTDNQNLTLNGTTLEIDNGASANLSGFMDNTDAQTLSISNDTLSIQNGNFVVIDDGDWVKNGDDVYFDKPGNVGVGTTSPDYKLDVNGNSRVGWFGSSDTVPILPTHFMGSSFTIHNARFNNVSGEFGVDVSDPNVELYATVPVPVGFKATKAQIFSDIDTLNINVYEVNLMNGDESLMGTGVSNTELTFSTAVPYSGTKYLLIRVSNISATTETIYGGYLIIERL